MEAERKTITAASRDGEILKSWKELRRGTGILFVGCAESAAHFAFFKKNAGEKADEPDRADDCCKLSLGNQTGANYSEDHSGVTRVADIFVEASCVEFSFAGKFCVAD